MRHEQLLQMAIDLATGNVAVGGGPFGAVVARAGEVVSTGVNQVTGSNDPTAHAEIVALRNAAQALSAFELQGCIIYSSCEPCPMCLGAILWARCDALYFGAISADAAAAGFDDEAMYREVCKPMADRALPSTNLLRGEAATSFGAWSRFAPRVAY